MTARTDTLRASLIRRMDLFDRAAVLTMGRVLASPPVPGAPDPILSAWSDANAAFCATSARLNALRSTAV